MFSGFRSLSIGVNRLIDETAAEGLIPVYHVEAVQMLQCTEELGRIEPTAALVEFALALQVVEELPSID